MSLLASDPCKFASNLAYYYTTRGICENRSVIHSYTVHSNLITTIYHVYSEKIISYPNSVQKVSIFYFRCSLEILFFLKLKVLSSVK
jgi:hypothetical protein